LTTDGFGSESRHSRDSDNEAFIVSDKNYLGASWVRFQSVPKGSAEYLELEWVVEQMWDLCGSEREKAWNAIQEIIALG
jgi:hypothetical protein